VVWLSCKAILSRCLLFPTFVIIHYKFEEFIRVWRVSIRALHPSIAAHIYSVDLG
jgi:hypothetical protein